MAYGFNFHDANAYTRWISASENRPALELEDRLMHDLFPPISGETLLGIGGGTGLRLADHIDSGMQMTGIDPSPYLIDRVREHFGSRVDLHRGHAEDLPFDDNAFHHACMILTLEFVEDPAVAIAEACRVAKDSLYIGFLNRYALKGLQRRVAGMFNDSIFNQARFFSVWEIKRHIREVAGEVPVRWRSVCQLTGGAGRIRQRIEKAPLVQRCPFGAYVGVRVSLMPTFRTRPLSLRIPSPKRGTGVVPG